MLTDLQALPKGEPTILECLKKQDTRDSASVSILPEDMRLFRFELVETFLLAGIEISKIA